jgi:hypothetical protein
VRKLLEDEQGQTQYLLALDATASSTLNTKRFAATNAIKPNDDEWAVQIDAKGYITFKIQLA